MSKDPAMMLYTSDFLTGTMLMTNEQVGKYIRLLCYEHQHGRMREKDMLNMCSTYDEDIFCKFKTDDAGLYYNCRLEEEQNKRIAYSESRKANRTLKKESYDGETKNISETYDEHMDNVIDNVHEVTIVTKVPSTKGKKPKPEPVSFDTVISEFTDNPAVIETIQAYIKMRKRIKKETTERVLHIVFNTIEPFDDEEKIKILNKSIVGGWPGVYPDNNQTKPTYQKKEPFNMITELKKMSEEEEAKK